MKRNLLALCLSAALLLGGIPAQAAALPGDNVDQLTWQQASAYYSLLYYSRACWASEAPGNIDDWLGDLSLTTTYASLLDFNGDGILDLFCLIHPDGSPLPCELASLWSFVDGKIVSLPLSIDQGWTQGQDSADYKIIVSGGSGTHTEAVYLNQRGSGYQLITFEHSRDYDENNDPVWTDITVTPRTPNDILLYDGSLIENDVDGLLERLRQKALQTDLSAAQTLAYWNVMEAVGNRDGGSLGYASIDNDLRGFVDPWFQGRFYDADGDRVTELEVIGCEINEYGDVSQYWQELWDFDGTNAYLVRREAPYPYTPLIRDSDYIQFDLTRDQLNHHWVVPVEVKVKLNGTATTLPGCQCEGNNYIRLRDIAMLLNGTEKQFDIEWRWTSFLITSTSYTPTNVEFGPIPLTSGIMQRKTSFDYLVLTPEDYQDLMIDNPRDWNYSEHADAFVFGGNNFVKLRDIAKVLDFYVGWDGAANTVVIDPARKYTD